MNPIQKSIKNPNSFRAAINAMCAYCMGCTDDHLEAGFRSEIRDCSAPHCPLWKLRPYQGQERRSIALGDSADYQAIQMVHIEDPPVDESKTGNSAVLLTG